MTLLNSFALCEDSESERTRCQRAPTNNEVLSLFQNVGYGTYREKLALSKGPSNKQIIAYKIPPSGSDAVNHKLSPQRRPVKASKYFQ